MRRAEAVCSISLRTRLLFVESEELPYTMLLVISSLDICYSLPYTSVSLNEIVELLAEELLADNDCDEGHAGLTRDIQLLQHWRVDNVAYSTTYA